MASPTRLPASLAGPSIDLTEPGGSTIDLTRPAPEPAGSHAVELVEAGSFAHAACSACGWTGPARRSRAVALKDLDRHP